MNMKWTRYLIAAATLATAVATGAAVPAAGGPAQDTQQPPPGGRGPGGRMGRGPGGPGMPGPGGPLGMLMLPPQLQLTEAQRQQLKALADSHRDEWRALAERDMAARKALQAAVTADVMDEGLIRQRAADMGAVEADLAVARARAMSEVMPLLTDDQKATLKQLRDEMLKDGPRGRGPGRGPGGRGPGRGPA